MLWYYFWSILYTYTVYVKATISQHFKIFMMSVCKHLTWFFPCCVSNVWPKQCMNKSHKITPQLWDVIFKTWHTDTGSHWQGLYTGYCWHKQTHRQWYRQADWQTDNHWLSTDVMVRDTSQTYFVGPERYSSSAASAELSLAIRTDVAAAIGKLGFVANSTGGRVGLLLGFLLSLVADLFHLVLIHLKLLVQLPVEEQKRNHIRLV